MADESMEQQVKQILDKLNASPVTNGKLSKLAEDVAVIASELPHIQKQVDDNAGDIKDNVRDISALKIGNAKLVGMLFGSGGFGGLVVAAIAALFKGGG